MKRIWKFQVPAAFLAVALMVICVIPKIEQKMNMNVNDKLAHLAGFMPLAFAILWGLRKQDEREISWTKSLGISFFVAWIYGGLIEFVQAYLVPSRWGDWLDFLADGIGALMGIGLYLLLRKVVQRPLLLP